MPVLRLTRYVVACDQCGHQPGDEPDDYYPSLAGPWEGRAELQPTAGAARKDARGWGFQKVGVQWYCDGCHEKAFPREDAPGKGV